MSKTEKEIKKDLNGKQGDPFDIISKYAGVAILVVVVFVVGIVVGRKVDLENKGIPFVSEKEITGDTDGSDQDLDELDFDLYWQIWETMTDNYVDVESVDEEAMFYDSIKGMVSSYGDFATLYLDPDETKAYNDSISGNYFSGIGAELGYRDGQIVVVAPLKGSPAIAAGLKPGDIIAAVDGDSVDADETIYEIVGQIRGESGTEVVLTVVRQGEADTLDITITRGDITIASMEFEETDTKGVVLIDLARFSESSYSEWEKKWDEIAEKVESSNAKGVVIDLRGNPGGYLDAAVYAAGEFLPRGTVVTGQEERNGDLSELKVRRNGALQDIPVIVLVNEGSASASEILAGALQQHDRATIIGEDTFGKGTAQNIIDYPDGSSLHITVMKWLLPDGTWINQDSPISPDIEVEYTDEAFKAGEDPQMDRAMEEIQKKI